MPMTLQQLIEENELRCLDGAVFDANTVRDKIVLIVNVASKCGLTPQYKQLVKLQESTKDKGLVVIGVPCNQFAGQEPGSAEEIQAFCTTTYGVTFPLLEKQDVNGSNRSALYDWLVTSKAGQGSDIEWNFGKFIVDREGKVVHRFSPSTTPFDKEILRAIKQLL